MPGRRLISVTCATLALAWGPRARAVVGETWRTFDVAIELTEQDARSSAGPRVRYAPVLSLAGEGGSPPVFVAPFVSYSVLKTSTSGKIGALAYGAGLGARMSDRFDVRWNVAAASWAGGKGTALTLGPEVGFSTGAPAEGVSVIDRVFLAAHALWQRPFARQFLLGLQLRF